ncbi:hypothetical protein OSB04_018938 [Centaurea solstitialis]|uniref:CCHC-type domain-containing protein n=1 Tax=Centaurea solstitialis TaxID=347529 RepID=A0AA38WBW7_9ASTR|nr:hypothetical protein OSB04_018938 [Centaurea solstitialis]
MKMYRYRGVLKTEIKEFVATAMCKSFGAMVEVARARELYLEEQHQGKRKAEQEQVPSKKLKGQRSDGCKEFPGCPKCGKNHSGECRLPEPICFKCGKPGHRSRECRGRTEDLFSLLPAGTNQTQLPSVDWSSSSSDTSFHSIDDHRRFNGKKSGSTTGGVDFQLERDRLASPLAIDIAVEEMFPNRGIVDGAEQLVRIQNPSGGELIVYGEGRRRQLGEIVSCLRWYSGGRAPELHREAGCGARVEGEKAGNQGDRDSEC